MGRNYRETARRWLPTALFDIFILYFFIRMAPLFLQDYRKDGILVVMFGQSDPLMYYIFPFSIAYAWALFLAPFASVGLLALASLATAAAGHKLLGRQPSWKRMIAFFVGYACLGYPAYLVVVGAVLPFWRQTLPGP